MSSFDERKDAFEKKFAHDEEMAFKVEARTCKLFGLWAAEKLGLSGSDADSYAKEVVASNLEEPGYDDVRRKVMPDFEEKGVALSDHEFDVLMKKYEDQAKAQLMEDI